MNCLATDPPYITARSATGSPATLPAVLNTVVFSDVTPTATPSARTARNLSASTASIRSMLT